ncbi:MAG: hypothetical protein J6D03_06960 [Clostridia bacterium]|nr:hypothetical protein [Clostridia bacterium]
MTAKGKAILFITYKLLVNVNNSFSDSDIWGSFEISLSNTPNGNNYSCSVSVLGPPLAGDIQECSFEGPEDCDVILSGGAQADSDGHHRISITGSCFSTQSGTGYVSINATCNGNVSIGISS